MVFSDVSGNTGIVQQVRQLCRVDALQLPIVNIVNSVNSWLDMVTGYAIGADRNFQWDDTNHTKLPIGTTNLIKDQKEYSFLTDEQGNKILTLTRIDVMDSGGIWRQLQKIDESQVPIALDEFNKSSSKPVFYDLVNDNVVKLYPASDTNVSAGLKFYFQRAPNYFTVSDATKEPGVAPIIHRGAIISAAYDCAITLGLSNVGLLGTEMQREDAKMKEYFADRNMDNNNKGFYPAYTSSR